MHWRACRSPITFEVGAFVDGPELNLSRPPDMPLAGTASYRGTGSRDVYRRKWIRCRFTPWSRGGRRVRGNCRSPCRLRIRHNHRACWMRNSCQGRWCLLRSIRKCPVVRHDDDLQGAVRSGVVRQDTRHLPGIKRTYYWRTAPRHQIKWDLGRAILQPAKWRRSAPRCRYDSRSGYDGRWQ